MDQVAGWQIEQFFRNVQDLADAQQRIAAADERRNELLLEDRAERREAWEREQAQMAERWGQISSSSVYEQPAVVAEVEIRKQHSAEWWRPDPDEHLAPGWYEWRSRIGEHASASRRIYVSAMPMPTAPEPKA